MAAISEKGATLQPKGNSSEDVIVKNSLYKADKVASKLSFTARSVKNGKRKVNQTCRGFISKCI